MCPIIRKILDGQRHLLIDLSVLNYLDNELRPEKGLKDLSKLLRTARYEQSSGGFRRYHNANDPELHLYNGTDSHSTLANVGVFARRILRDHAGTDKLSPFCIRFYSDNMWSTLRMSEAGIPMDRNSLLHYEQILLRRCSTAASVMKMRFGVALEGEGSNKEKLEFMEDVVTYVEECINPDIRDHSLFQLTEKQHQISINDVNRLLMEHFINEAGLDDDSSPEYLLGLKLLGMHLGAQKQLSTYTFPLLRHKRKDKNDYTSCLIPGDPSWAGTSRRSRSNSRTARSGKGPRANSARYSGSAMSPQGEPSTGPPCGTPSPPSNPLLLQTQQKQRRKRTSKQWLTRRQTKMLIRGRRGTPKQQKLARKKAAERKLALVTYSPAPTTDRLPWVERVEGRDIWFAHPTWFVTPSFEKDDSGGGGGTIQGRITCKGPAAQTFPDEIKSHITSRWPEGFIVWFDLSQIELRVAALLSGDRELLDAYCSSHPVDLHTTCAEQVFGTACLSDPDFKKKYRTPSKHFRFGHLYRAGGDKLQLTILRKSGIIVPLSFCEKVAKERPYTQPGLWRWQERMIREARADCRVILPFTGQSRAFLGGDAYDVSEIVNMPIQTTAGNLMLRIQSYIHQHGPDLNATQPPFHMFINIYDALGFDCRDREATEEVTALIHAAVAYEESFGYWRMVCDWAGRDVPLAYERTIQDTQVE